MIKVKSANNKKDYFINHRKIEIIKQIGHNSHIILDNGKTFIVTNDIEDIKKKIIEFESSINYTNTILKTKDINKEVLSNE